MRIVGGQEEGGRGAAPRRPGEWRVTAVKRSALPPLPASFERLCERFSGRFHAEFSPMAYDNPVTLVGSTVFRVCLDKESRAHRCEGRRKGWCRTLGSSSSPSPFPW